MPRLGVTRQYNDPDLAGVRMGASLASRITSSSTEKQRVGSRSFGASRGDIDAIFGGRTPSGD